jgi:hypothetical protein
MFIYFKIVKVDEFVKSRKVLFFVIPANARQSTLANLFK